MLNCSKCYGNDLEALVWIDLVTNEIVDRCDEYHCRSCGGRVDVIITSDPEWIEDIETLKEDDEKQNTHIVPISGPANGRGTANLSIDD